MIGDHLSHRKVSSCLLLQLDTLVGNLTLPLLVTWSKATGLQMVSEVRFLETILAFFDYFPGHTVAQVHLIFRLLQYDIFFTYVQRFRVTTPPPSNTTNSAAGMHILKRVITNNGMQVGDIIPLHYIRSPAHVIPCFGKEANPHLAHHTCYDLSCKFWLNRYWNKEFYYVLSLN